MFPADVPAWSYQATFTSGTVILGTYHAVELPPVFFGGDDMARSMQAVCIAFVDCLDPNKYSRSATPNGYLSEWPTWREGGRQVLEFGREGTGVKDGGKGRELWVC